VRELTHQDVVLRPVVTEKTIKQAERWRTYTFEVREDTNKVQIRRAVERIFSVHVTGVRTMRYMGKARRVGRSVGTTAPWKKALVQLREGETIDFV
jgi:large subunit ribosomal protein L23